ncbi:hypothetical protein CS063_06615 [Sporanaerobium hydrogeniformans]|uniref:Uncharacterized protein n=1 Tax=Sporanaerobium hydrogeniformans TaxID=3072179 RepID=A0AC61DDM3_9FIRM|nr:hypothetical protein [Sporanaerobium hydrogeniformans]PHV71359.1 hypothetical protein CS063_06615 [Sporanaerobium hydrogeniformans]
MEELFQKLKGIIEVLEQIKTLTDNQTTVLLSEITTLEEESNLLDMIEQMAAYKDEMMNALHKEEDEFQKLYAMHKQSLAESNCLADIQKQVGSILQMQQIIVETEQNNLLLMQKRVRMKSEKVALPANHAKVTAAYQRQQKKS